MSETGKHPILLVDDEPEILFSLKGLLRREFELHTAESGREAMKILNEHPIHVVMTDQRMPEMTGVQLMEHVAEHHPEAIRIVFTGYADIKAVVDAINSGGLYRYITKPWDPDELIAVLHQAADKYDELVEHKRLLGDLSEHVRQGWELAQGLIAAGDVAAATAVDPAAFLEQARQLAERLERVRRA
jgi:DNA-binding NtrC family response regulator